MFKGSIVALITPFQNNKLDEETYIKLINFHLENGTNGLVPAGTTGESPTLSHAEHNKVIELCINEAKGRIPVIAGTGSNSTDEAVALTKHAENVGADGALVVTPYYNKPSQKGLIEHYTKIADSVDIPQILYNVPSRTACDLLPKTVEILAEHQNIIGIKESVSDENRINDLIKISNATDEKFVILSGDDPSFAKLMEYGGHGVISVAANVIPNAISEICFLISEGKIDEAIKKDETYHHLYELLFVESNPVPVKWMLHKMKMIRNSLRLPLVKLDEKFHGNINAEMLRLRLL